MTLSFRLASQSSISRRGSASISLAAEPIRPAIRAASPGRQFRSPIGIALNDRISERLKPGNGRSGGRGAQRRPKALVGTLMGVDRRRDGVIERIGRGKVGAPIVGQRCIDRQRVRGDVADKAVQPVFGDEIEQGRDRNQVFCASSTPSKLPLRSSGTAFSLTSAEAFPLHAKASRCWSLSTRSQMLSRRQMRTKRTDGRAGAAAEVDDVDGVERFEPRGHRREHGRIARLQIMAFPQGQPLG